MFTRLLSDHGAMKLARSRQKLTITQADPRVTSYAATRCAAPLVRYGVGGSVGSVGDLRCAAPLLYRSDCMREMSSTT